MRSVLPQSTAKFLPRERARKKEHTLLSTSFCIWNLKCSNVCFVRSFPFNIVFPRKHGWLTTIDQNVMLDTHIWKFRIKLYAHVWIYYVSYTSIPNIRHLFSPFFCLNLGAHLYYEPSILTSVRFITAKMLYSSLLWFISTFHSSKNNKTIWNCTVPRRRAPKPCLWTRFENSILLSVERTRKRTRKCS